MSIQFPTLRNWNETDIPLMVEHANNKKISDFMTDSFPNPYGIENAVNFVQMAMNSQESIFKCIDLNGEPIGGIGIHPQKDIQRKNAELGYWLSEKHWGKGYMTHCVREMINIGFRELDIFRIFGNVFDSNIGSQKVLEKAGLNLEAVLKKAFYKNENYVDVHIYSICRPDWKQT
jgi:[ribosomal protein S5]-alanine N-acetyltransferase